jgi:SseB protein N-terminal domain
MTLPELVIVPARPGAGDAYPVQFEVRVHADGRAVLPVFSTVAALVRALGRYQPWVCVPLHTARESAARAGLAQMVLDPEVTSSSLRWTAFSLEASAQDRTLHE